MSMPLSSEPLEHGDGEAPPRPLRALDVDPPRAAALPDPPQIGVLAQLEARVIGAIAVFAFEAVEGIRQVAQLGKWVTTRVADELDEVRRLNVERRSLYHDTRRIVPVVGRVRATSPTAWVTEAAVVLLTPSRSRAVAMRFEAIRGRWQATSITVL